MQQPLSLPVALHIGYRKTGTSWFQAVALPNHAAVGLSTSNTRVLQGLGLDPIPPEDDPFLREVVVTPDRDFDVARTRAALADLVDRHGADDRRLVVVSVERLSGHGASGGYDGIRIARRLHQVVPEAKVFWFVRPQASAIRAEYKQLVVEGWLGTFDETIAGPTPWRTIGFDLGHWEYDRLVQAYHDLYGTSAVRVIDYGNLRADPRTVLDELADFLGLDPWKLSDAQLGRRVNVSKDERWVRWARVLNYVRRTEMNPYPFFELSDRVRGRLLSAMVRVPARPLFPADFDARMQDRFAESNERLRQLTGIEL